MNFTPSLYVTVTKKQLHSQAPVMYTGSMLGKKQRHDLAKGSLSRSNRGWKDAQSRIKISRRNKLALFVLGLVVGLLLLSWGIKFTQSLFNSWNIQTNIPRKYHWNGEFNLNLLIRTDKISLLSYNPKESKVAIVNIPDETFLEVPFGFGSWQLRSVYELGESQKQLGGHKLLVNTITNFLAVPVDGFLDLKDLNPERPVIEIVDSLRKNPFFIFNLLPVLKTDLNLLELLRLDFRLSKVRFDKVEEISLDKLNVLDKGTLPDGTFVFTGDPVKLDSVLSVLADPKIVSEHKTIAVFNGTSKGQMAVKWARLIRNLVGNVIITGNTEEVRKTKVTGEKSVTLKRLQQIFATDNAGDSQELNSSRAQINLLLGEDYVNK